MTDQHPATTEQIPLAQTLDEQALRQIFAGAPADLSVPKDIGALFNARMKRFGGSRRTLMLVVWAVLVLAALGLALGGQLAGGIALGAVVLIVTIGVLVWQRSAASDDFFDAYARARGLDHVEHSRVDADVPLFDKGDKRKWNRVLLGSIAAQPASISHFTYTDVSTDSEGNRTETDYDFTTVNLTLPPAVAARYVGVSLRPRSMSLGKLQDALSHDRKVELESAEFAKRYTLRVVDSQDDIALYELFSTSFVHRLATELTVYWEQRGDDLVVWRKGHQSDAATLDRMCLEAWHVLQRYAEEYR